MEWHISQIHSNPLHFENTVRVTVDTHPVKHTSLVYRVQFKSGSATQVTWALHQESSWKKKVVSALLFSSEISHLMPVSGQWLLSQHWREDSDRLHHVAEAQQALPRRMLIQADHWHPGRPITISVSLTTMPKIPWLLNEAKPLKDLAGSPAASWLQSQLWRWRQTHCSAHTKTHTHTDRQDLRKTCLVIIWITD